MSDFLANQVVSGSMLAVSGTVTRPADTTAYAALDVISNSTSAPVVMTFSNIARVTGGSGYVMKIRIFTNNNAVVPRLRLHLFHTAPTAINDNSPYTLLSTNFGIGVRAVDFPSLITEGTGSNASYTANSTDTFPYICASGSQNLFGILQTLDAFTPASGQIFSVEITVDNN